MYLVYVTIISIHIWYMCTAYTFGICYDQMDPTIFYKLCSCIHLLPRVHNIYIYGGEYPTVNVTCINTLRQVTPADSSIFP